VTRREPGLSRPS